MICLSLRVSGEKNPDCNKMIDQRVDDIKSVIKKTIISYPSSEKWLISLVTASTLKELISAVASMFSDIINNTNKQDGFDKLNVLMVVYMKLPSSNPLKKYILSSFSELPDNKLKILIEVIISSFPSRFAKECFSEDSNEFVSLLHCINSCYDKDPNYCEQTISGCSKCIFLRVKEIIVSCLEYLGDPSVTPVFKEEMLKNIHCLTQCIIIFLHKLKPQYLSDFFLESCLKFLDKDDLPLNTKTNLSIIIGMVNQMSDTYKWNELVQRFDKAKPITVVSLCSGIFSGASESLWLMLDDGQYLADFLLFQLLKLEENNSSDCKLVLGVSRGICQYTKVRSSSEINLTCVNASLETIFSYIWVHLEHPMDAVRHLASESLANVVLLGRKYPESDIINYIMKEVIRIPVYRRSKYVILSSLVGNIPVVVLLNQVPNLVDILLLSVKESSGAKHVIVSIEKLLSQHFIEIEDKTDWLHIWVDPILESLNSGTNPIMEQILSQIIKLNPSVIDYIFNLNDKVFNNKIKIILLSLRVSQKIGVLKGSSDAKWKGFIEYKFLESCLHHKERDARLSLFGLIVDSPKSTEILTANELSLVRSFLMYNVNCQSASFRQSFLALFKKLLVRMNDSHNHDKCSIVKSDSGTAMDSNNGCSYFTFLDWLVEFCCHQLFPGASFSRRSTVLSMLSLIFSYKLYDPDIFSKKMAHRLLYVLQADTYEENKKLAKEIIQQLNFDLLGLDDEKKIYDAFTDCLSFASSIRPPDCISAAYSLSTILKFSQVKDTFCELANCVKGFQKHDIKELGIHYCLSMIVEELTSKTEVAQRSIHKAAKEGPMYGLLFTIRHILQDVDLHELSTDKYWMELIKSIIQIGIHCTEAVSCIVNNSSPEGHFPMDLSLDFSNLTLTDGSHQATSQLLLLCSWRTVKEVCLLFGEIVERIDIYPEDDDVHFSVKDVLKIGDHLTSLLSEIKHRGAFEQAYIGFCKLASILWKYPKGHLHELPSLWLKETLGEIANENSKAKLCATRRSAGIPFIIQALVVTEREVLGGKQLGWTVQRVLELGNSSSESWETRVHAMNILRSLYRSSHLGEAVSPFVAQGFIISFNGFNGKTWPERNSATLLFSAIITRVFGVNRSRSYNLSWKNKMTGRIFFQRYPELYSVILNKLKNSSESDLHSVFPVLLLLSRLYPSSLEGSDSNLRLENLIPFITKCGSSRIMKIRSLAASALVGLIYPFNICDQISNTLANIDEMSPENSVHGCLLQILQLFKNGPDIPVENKYKFNDLLSSWFSSILTIVKVPRRSMVTKSSCLSILFQILLKYHDDISKANLECLYNFILQETTKQDNSLVQKAIGFHEYIEFCSILLIFYSLKYNNVENASVLFNLLNNHNYEVNHVILEFFLSVLTGTDASSDEMNQLIRLIGEHSKSNLLNSIQLSEPLRNYFVEKVFSSSLHHEDSVKLMSVLKELPSVIRHISFCNSGVIKLFSNFYYTESLKPNILQCISSYITIVEKDLSGEDVKIISELLLESIKSDFDCRMSAADFCVKHYKLLINGYTPSTVFAMWNAMVHLFCDDCEEIRDRISDILLDQIDSVLALETFFELLNNISENKFIFACALTAWAIGPFCEEQYTLEESEKAFDRGDMNSYKEDIVLTTIASAHLKKLFVDFPEFLDRTLSTEEHIWLDNYTGLTTSCSTLHDVILSLDQYMESVSDNFKGKYKYFVNFSTSHKNFSLLNEKNDLITYK